MNYKKAAGAAILLSGSVWAAERYQRPSPAETLAFLQSLPPIQKKVDGKKVFVQNWKDKTVNDIKTLTEIQPGGHVEGGDHMRVKGDDWRYFTALENLKIAKLFEMHGADDRAFYHLGHLSPTVEYLFVELAELSDDGVKSLQTLPNLKFLGIGWTTTITDAALKHMAGIRSLEEILVSGCKGIGGSGMETLAALKNLKKLQIAGTSVTDASLPAFAKLSIEELNLAQNNVSYEGLKKLLNDPGALPNLTTLKLNKVNLPENLQELTQSRPKLKIER